MRQHYILLLQKKIISELISTGYQKPICYSYKKKLLNVQILDDRILLLVHALNREASNAVSHHTGYQNGNGNLSDFTSSLFAYQSGCDNGYAHIL